MNKVRIERNFSKSAGHYDRYSAIQERVGCEVVRRIRGRGYRRILDVGCGTGTFTRLLAERFPAASITAVDISREMIGEAMDKLRGARVDFVVGDAESTSLDGKFDLISSNAAFQWFRDLDGALLRQKDMLKSGGVICFSQFGPRTFYELGEAVSALVKKDSRIASSFFMDAKELKEALARYFRKTAIEEKIYIERHAHVRDLLEKIRYTGTRGSSLGLGRLWTDDMIKELDLIYKRIFRNITSTYQVFFCRGEM